MSEKTIVWHRPAPQYSLEYTDELSGEWKLWDNYTTLEDAKKVAEYHLGGSYVRVWGPDDRN